MRNTDIFIELIRLAEQAGTVTKAGLSAEGNCWVEVKDRNGNFTSFAMHKEEK